MRIRLTASLALVFLFLTSQVSLADDYKELTGTWNITAAEFDGTEIPVDSFPYDAIVIKRGQLIFMSKGNEATKSKLKLNTSVSPKQMTWTLDGQDPMDVIYEVKESKLRICSQSVKDPAKKKITAPASFETKGQKSLLLVAEKE